jgi:hypothetical protein
MFYGNVDPWQSIVRNNKPFRWKIYIMRTEIETNRTVKLLLAMGLTKENKQNARAVHFYESGVSGRAFRRRSSKSGHNKFGCIRDAHHSYRYS